MSLLEAIVNDLKRTWFAFKVKWLESELEYLDRQIQKQEKIIAECDAKLAAKAERGS